MSQATAYFTNMNGSIRDFTSDEVAEIGIATRGVKDHTHGVHTREVNASTVRRNWFCNFDMLERFLAYMLGVSVRYVDAGTPKISRLLPQTYPGKPQFAAVKLDEAKPFRYQGELDADGVPLFDKYECTFTYQHVPFDLKTDAQVAAGAERDRYVQTLPSQGEANYLNLPGGVMQYIRETGAAVPHGKPIPYSTGFPIPTATIRRKWVRVPFDCWGEGTDLFLRVYGDLPNGELPFVGTINTVGMFGYPPGYLLYLGVEEELQLDPLGDGLCWDLTHRWMANYLAPHTYKYFFSASSADAGDNGWYFTAKSGSSFYTTALLPDDTALHNARDHRYLFTVAP
jgi:hypothetical protein